MTRENIMEAMSGIGDHLIAEAAEKLGFLNGAPAVGKGRKRKGPSAFSRIVNNGWVVAAVCALVAVSVMGGIIWAGHQPMVDPPVVTPEESETVGEATEPVSETETVEEESSSEDETEELHNEHIWGEWTFVQTPSCTEGGSRARSCTAQNCEATETELWPAGLHTFESRSCTLCGESSSVMDFTSYGDGTCYLSDVGRLRGDIVIPNYSPEGELVIAIGDSAFANESGSFDSLVWPEGLRSIGAGDFMALSLPECFALPEGLLSVGDKALAYCRGITKLHIPASVTQIGAEAFVSSSLEEITFGEGIRLFSIPDGFAQGCSLAEITLPDSVTSIGARAFSESSLIKCHLPESVTEIGDYAFAYCSSLTKFNLPESITKMGIGVFVESSALPYQTYGGCLYLPIGDRPYALLAKAECAEITMVDIHPDMEMMVGGAFEGCTLLSEITIPEGQTTIADRLFYGCTSLHTVHLPDTVTTIGAYAFYECSALTELPKGAGLTIIGEYAFSLCHGLTEIALPEGVTAIGAYAFMGCNNLLRVQLPEGMTCVSKGMFYRCRLLADVTLPEGITHIDAQAFAWMDLNNTKGLMINIPKSVVYMGAQSFADSTVDLQYDGTMAEWEAIEKEENCFGGQGMAGAVCTDGVVSLNT